MAKYLSLWLVLSCTLALGTPPLGVQLGVSHSRSTRPGDVTTGLLVGLSTDIDMVERLGFAPEVNLLVPSGNVTYLSLPLLARYRAPLSEAFDLLAFLGPSLGFRLSGPTFKATNFWAMIGVGVEGRLSLEHRLRAMLRTAFGLSDFSVPPGDDRLHLIQFVLAYHFHF